MATTPSAATPSPPPHIHTPPTPRLGFADSWEPYSPRKSSRLAAASSSKSKTAAASSAATHARTPSPSAATRRAVRQLRSPRQPAAPSASSASSASAVASLSPAPTPRKKRAMPATHHLLSPEDALRGSKKTAAAAAAAAGESSRTRMGLGMLPTPAKTPSKKHHAASQNESNIAAIARNLFHADARSARSGHSVDDAHDADVDEVMASPTKTPSRKPKKYTGISLESFAVVEDEEPIPIFTDSQDRVPEADSSVENPFFGDGASAAPSAAPVPARRRSKRSHVSVPGEGRLTVEDATRREDGLVYVFRGKKIFRKFDDSFAAQEEDILEGAGQGRRLTRSSIKPRLLFPRDDSVVHTASFASFASNGTNGGTTEDEEAVTDIEDHNLHDSDLEDAELPAATPYACVDDAAPNTPPNAPAFAPSTPPVTGRTTRSGQKAAEEHTHTPMQSRSHAAATTATSAAAASKAPKKRSPFDSWRQTKGSAAAAGHKRPVEDLGSAVPAGAKRPRA